MVGLMRHADAQAARGSSSPSTQPARLKTISPQSSMSSLATAHTAHAQAHAHDAYAQAYERPSATRRTSWNAPPRSAHAQPQAQSANSAAPAPAPSFSCPSPSGSSPRLATAALPLHHHASRAPAHTQAYARAQAQAQAQAQPAPLPVAPFHTPGTALYLADPRRLNVLALGIAYAAVLSAEPEGEQEGAFDASSGATSASAYSAPMRHAPSATSTAASHATNGTSASGASTASTPATTPSGSSAAPYGAYAFPTAGAGGGGAEPQATAEAKRARRFSFGGPRRAPQSHAHGHAHAQAGSSDADEPLSPRLPQRQLGSANASAGTGAQPQAQVHAQGSGQPRKRTLSIDLRTGPGRVARDVWADVRTAARGVGDRIGVGHQQASAHAQQAQAQAQAQHAHTAPHLLAAGRSIDSALARRVSAALRLDARPSSMTYRSGADASGHGGAYSQRMLDPEVPLDFGARAALALGERTAGFAAPIGQHEEASAAHADAEADADAGALVRPLLEFVADTEPLVSVSRSASANGSSSGLRSQASAASLRAPFDPLRLVLKAAPPEHAAAELWRRAGHAQAAHARSVLQLRARLRVSIAADARTSEREALATSDVLFVAATSAQRLYDALSVAATSAAAGGAASSFSSSSSEGPDADATPDVLHADDALLARHGIWRKDVPLGAPHNLAGVGSANANTASAAAAAGVAVARDHEFEWQWDPSAALRNGSSAPGTKLACAFVEVAPSGRISVLSYFQFWVAMPVAQPPAPAPGSTASAIPMTTNGSSGNASLTTPGRVTPMQSGRARREENQSSPRVLHASLGPDAPSIIAALDGPQDLFSNSPASSQKRLSDASSARRSSNQASSPLERSPRSMGNTLGLQPFPQSPSTEVSASEQEADQTLNAVATFSGVRSAHLDINRTDIALEDAEEDSPVFRAAIAGLEKRTASLKKACKALLRVWSESKTHILVAQHADAQMHAALDELAALAPNTLGQLKSIVLDPAREKDFTRQRERMDMLDQHIEAPVQRLLDLCRHAQEQIKAFEAESKAYYASMQKWMSSRSGNAASNTASPMIPSQGFMAESVGMGSGAQGNTFDIPSEKQNLRQLSFTRARIELFAVMSRLHGGKAELELFRDALAMATWCTESPAKLWGTNWPSESARTTLTSLRAGSKETTAQADAMEQLVLSRLNELDRQINTLEAVTKAGAPETGDRADAVRATGHRIKSLLTTLGIASKESGAAGSAIDPAGGAAPGSPGGAAKPLSKARHLVSSKLSLNGAATQSSLPAHSQAPATAPLPSTASPMAQALSRWRTREEAMSAASAVQPSISNGVSTPLKSAASKRHSLGSGISAIRRSGGSDDAGDRFACVPTDGSPTLSRRATSGGYRPSLNNADGRLRRASVRQTSDDGAMSPRAPSFGLGISAGATRLDNSDNNSSAAPSGVTRQAGPRPMPTRLPSLQVGKERKKQGVLWVSKTTSISSGDTPRAVTRAYHWHEAWVVLSGSGHLGEYADWKDAKVLEPSAPIIDLRFATVREARGLDRRFTFEVVTRDSRRFFQAADEASLKEWVTAISRAIESLINGTSSVRQVDKVVRSSQLWNPAEMGSPLESGDEFSPRDRQNESVASNKAFSQSLTDLTSPTGGAARLLQWGTEAAAGLARGKRDSRILTRVSESDAGVSSQLLSGGISNKTPVSGYVPVTSGSKRASNVSDSGFSASSEVDAEFDRRIEEIVHSSFGSDAGKKRATGHGLSASTGATPANVAASAAPARSKAARAAEIAEISRRAENQICADCRTKEPRWASWALCGEPCCIFICIDCSGVHRSLGVQVSKVKSTDLDDWTEEQIEAARRWGNLKANEYWEYSRPETAVCSRADTTFWTEKYSKRAWCPPMSLQQWSAEQDRRRRDSMASIASYANQPGGMRRSMTETDTSRIRTPASPRRQDQVSSKPNFSLPAHAWSPSPTHHRSASASFASGRHAT